MQNRSEMLMDFLKKRKRPMTLNQFQEALARKGIYVSYAVVRSFVSNNELNLKIKWKMDGNRMKKVVSYE